MVTVRWTGAAGLDITSGGSTWMIDPFPSRPSKVETFGFPLRSKKAAVRGYLEGLPGRPEALVSGHTHHDHALDVPEIAQRFDGPVIGSTSLDSLLFAHGLHERVTVCHGGEQLELPGGAKLTMVPSVHGKIAFGRIPLPGEIERSVRPPLRARQYRCGDVFSPLIEVGGVRVCNVGSANLVDAELSKVEVDVLFLCVPGWKATHNYHARVLNATRPSVVVPFHFDDFTAPLQIDRTAGRLPMLDMQKFIDRIRTLAPGARVIVPRLYEELQF